MYFHFHPFTPFINNDTTKIIVGTLPPYRFCTNELKPCDVKFCYGSQDNLLWQVIDNIYSLELLFNNSDKAVNQRKEFLSINKIGICDIVESCKREKLDASDLGMSEIILRPMLKILKEYKNIDTLIFTGGNSKNGPEYFLRKILREANIEYKMISEEIPKIHSFCFEDREFKTISLTSPSNAANRSIGANKTFKERRIQNPSYSTFDFRCEQYEKIFSNLTP